MGSVPEGTRLGVANEMDISIEFEGLADSPLGVKLEDPYHLYSTESLPAWMKAYSDSRGRFLLGKFKHDLLKAVDLAVSEVLQEHPTRLCAYKQNCDYNFQDCEQCKQNMDSREKKTSLFRQCRDPIQYEHFRLEVPL